MNKITKLTTGVTGAVSGVLTSVGMALAAEQKTSTTQQAIGQIKTPQGFFPDIGKLFTNILTFVLAIAALLVFAYLIWGGIEWITSGGDKSKTESARSKITGAIVGLIILVAAYAIFQLIMSVLGITVTDMFTKPQEGVTL